MRQKTSYIADELPNSFSKFYFLKRIIFRGEANTHLTPYPYSGYRSGSWDIKKHNKWSIRKRSSLYQPPLTLACSMLHVYRGVRSFRKDRACK